LICERLACESIAMKETGASREHERDRDTTLGARRVPWRRKLGIG
jgi:hypothetical protein